MTQNKSKQDQPQLEATSQATAIDITIPADTLEDIVNRLQWILNPEVFFDPNSQKTTEDALNRCRLRARDLLFQLLELLPRDHHLAVGIDRALVKSRLLPISIGIMRESPGESSKIGHSSWDDFGAEKTIELSEAFSRFEKLLEKHEALPLDE